MDVLHYLLIAVAVSNMI